MAEYDLVSRLKVVPTIAVASHDAIATGADVDTKGFESVMIERTCGALGGGTAGFIVEHADDDGAGSPDTYTAVADADLIGTEADLLAADTVDDGLVATLGYIGKKQWVRVKLTEDVTMTTCLLGVNVVLGNPRVVPTSQ